MKHKLKITLIILTMFLVTQLIGLYVVGHYSPVKVVNGEKVNVSAPGLPFGLETPQVEKQSEFLTTLLPSIIFAFVVAILLIFLLTKFHSRFILRLWFFVVIIIALGISFNSVIDSIAYSSLIAAAIAVPLAAIKIYGRNLLVHNSTELLIYPGIAAVFVPILNIYTIIILLVIISIYDMWAVWHSGIMQKMAKYQMNELKVFGGFMIPYISKKLRKSLKKLKPSQLKKKKIQVSIAILGGGDVVFPIIAAGVVLVTWGLIPALLVILGALLGLTYLLIFSEKKKFYPAMPFITAGILLGMFVGWLIA